MASENTQTKDNSLITTTRALLEDALTRFEKGTIAVSFSGAEDVVLIDLIHRLGYKVDVFSLDTGRLHPETYEFIEKIRTHYATPIELLSPDAKALGELVKEKGLFSFREDGHGECCGVRKIQPLEQKLSHLKAWITGQRKDQSVTRTDVPFRYQGGEQDGQGTAEKRRIGQCPYALSGGGHHFIAVFVRRTSDDLA